MFVTAWCAFMLLIAGTAVGLWQILSAPDRPNYPTSGTLKRILMFWFSGSLLFRAVEIFTGLYDGTQPVLNPSIALSATLLAALMTTFLVDHVRHWLPARTHDRIRQLLAIARCRPSPALVRARRSSDVSAGVVTITSADAVSPALVDLAMSGVRVVGPNGGPEAIR